jgi:hypothetical protein
VYTIVCFCVGHETCLSSSRVSLMYVMRLFINNVVVTLGT